MKKIAALALAVLAVAAVVVPAASARHSVAHRLTALETKVKGLQATVKTLKTQNAQFARELSCFTGGAPVARFNGYVYDPDGTGPDPEVLTTALDVTGTGETPQAFFATVEPTCLTNGRRLAGVLVWPAPVRKAPL